MVKIIGKKEEVNHILRAIHVYPECPFDDMDFECIDDCTKCKHIETIIQNEE